MRCILLKKLGGGRDIIIDSCVLGMGLAAGNLQTELIANYLSSICHREFSIDSILKACEVISGLHSKGLWGYSMEYLVPALRKTAYKYAKEYRDNYSMSYSDIYGLLKGMPDAYRYRFTKEQANAWVKKYIGIE